MRPPVTPPRLTAGGADEVGEQWVRTQRRRLEFGMELAGNEPGMRRKFDQFDQAAIG